ncbi:MAG: GNAT family N-acetyltransferase, partial [Deltaproteobacteria bacterium]|nr:GNAT family N-acetyltransferase [Deltaproteobacteria bacterium]
PFFLRRISAAALEAEMTGGVRPIIPTRGTKLWVLQPLGSGEVCSDFVGFIAERGRTDEVWSALYTYFLREVRGFDLLDLTHVRDDEPGFESLQYAAMGGRNWRYRPLYQAPYAELPAGGYEAYLDTLSKKSRYNARKKIKEIRIYHTVEHRFHDDAETLPQAMDRFFDLHAQRWAAEGQTGVFASEKMAAFHRDFAARALRLGWLRLGFLSLDDEPPIFATYAFHAADAVYLYQQGSAPVYPEFNLGYAALVFAIQDACERGARRYEFLRGEADYKLHWAKNGHPLIQFLAGATFRGTRFFARSFINTDPRVRRAVKRIVLRGRR